MRILQATTRLRYGSGIVFVDLCRTLARMGHQVQAIYTTCKELPTWPELDEQLRASGVRIRRIDLFKRDVVSLWNAEAFTFQSGNHEQLSQLLVQTIQEPPSAERLDAMSQRIKSTFSPTRFAEQHLQLYEKLLGSRSSQ